MKATIHTEEHELTLDFSLAHVRTHGDLAGEIFLNIYPDRPVDPKLIRRCLRLRVSSETERLRVTHCTPQSDGRIDLKFFSAGIGNSSELPEWIEAYWVEEEIFAVHPKEKERLGELEFEQAAAIEAREA